MLLAPACGYLAEGYNRRKFSTENCEAEDEDDSRGDGGRSDVGEFERCVGLGKRAAAWSEA